MPNPIIFNGKLVRQNFFISSVAWLALSLPASAADLTLSGNSNAYQTPEISLPTGDAVVLTGDDNELINKTSINVDGKSGLKIVGDRNTIINHGQIDTVDTAFVSDVYPVEVFGDNNTLTNYGVITSSETGMQMKGKGNTLVNHGNITAAGRGMVVNHDGAQPHNGEGSLAINYGTIDAGYSGIHVISDESSGINHGKIITGSNGIIASSKAGSAINYGEIDAQRTGLFIDFQGNTGINHGKITSQGKGILAFNGANHITNTGEIYSTGRGIDVNDDNIIKNSGTIFVEDHINTDAVYLGGNDNHLYLQAGSLLQGRIRNDGARNSIYVSKELDAVYTITSTSRSADLNVVGEGQTLIYSNDKIISLSGDGLSEQAGYLAQANNNLSRHLTQNLYSRSLSGLQCIKESEDCNNGFWLSIAALGDEVQQSANFSRAIVAQTFGYDHVVAENTLTGVFAGYAKVNADSNTWETNSDTSYIGAYYSRTFESYVYALSIIAGKNWADLKREYLDNTQLGGIAKTNADQTGYFISPAVTLGYTFSFDGVSLTPSLTTRYTYNKLKGYTEDGAEGFTLQDQKTSRIDARAQLTSLWEGEFSATQAAWRAELRGGVETYKTWDSTVTLKGFGEELSTQTLEDETGTYPFLGASFTHTAQNGLKLVADIEASYDNSEAVNGTTSLSATFAF